MEHFGLLANAAASSCRINLALDMVSDREVFRNREIHADVISVMLPWLLWLQAAVAASDQCPPPKPHHGTASPKPPI
jgi:hypothetical protein